MQKMMKLIFKKTNAEKRTPDFCPENKTRPISEKPQCMEYEE